MTEPPAPLASFKLRFADEHVRIVPLRDLRGCAFSGPGVDLRGEAARDVLALAAPVVAWLAEREPLALRSLSMDLGRRRVLATFGALSAATGARPHVLRIDAHRDPAGARAILDLARPLVARLAELAFEQLARREARAPEASPSVSVVRMGRVEGKVALVTGAASGIGRATALRLAEQGARVVVTDRAVEAGLAVAAEIGPSSFFQPLDVTREAEWIAAMEATARRFGRLDVLVNNAGVGVVKDIESTTLEEWRFVHAVNAEGTFLGCREAIKAMRASAGGGGSIVNVSSIAGLVGEATLAAYCSSKGAVRLLTKSIAMHCAQRGYGIRCNSVHPSFIATPMVEAMIEAAPDHDKARAQLTRAAPLGRLGDVDDVAYLILYLASDESKFITGAEMVVDGGATAR